MGQDVLLWEPLGQLQVIRLVRHFLCLPLPDDLLLEASKDVYEHLAGLLCHLLGLQDRPERDQDDPVLLTTVHEVGKVLWQGLGWAAVHHSNVLVVWRHGVHSVHEQGMPIVEAKADVGLHLQERTSDLTRKVLVQNCFPFWYEI